MKRIILFSAALAFFSLDSLTAQVTGINTGTGATAFSMTFTPRDKKDNSEEFKKISHKMYLTTAYLPAKVDNINETFYLRYNMYTDEMEFIKGDESFYLKKIEGREVRFSGLGTNYQIKDLNGDLQYLVVHNTGKTVLYSRLSVKFLEAEEMKSSYVKPKPANFRRNKDVLYISLDGASLVKVPTKKKDFYAMFGDKSSSIKSYMKKNKLGYKNAEDVAKVVDHYNTL